MSPVAREESMCALEEGEAAPLALCVSALAPGGVWLYWICVCLRCSGMLRSEELPLVQRGTAITTAVSAVMGHTTMRYLLG